MINDMLLQLKVMDEQLAWYKFQEWLKEKSNERDAALTLLSKMKCKVNDAIEIGNELLSYI